MTEDLSLSTLKPAQKRRARKRVGRGLGSGKGRYSGRGIKGQKARSGSHKMSPAFEGGQMPVHMRTGKLRGPHSKDAMPMGPFRTFTFAVNVRDLERFDNGAQITPESLKAAGLIKNLRADVKILGHGDLTRKLTVSVHRFSASAVKKIEAAGGTVNFLKEPKRVKRRRGRKKAAGAAAEESVASADQEQEGDAAPRKTSPPPAPEADEAEE